jgi:protein TonB
LAPVVKPPPAPPAIPKETPKPPPAAVITNPDWTSKPSGDQFASYYPERAQRMNVNGRVVLNCAVSAKGTLENCAIESETPPDQQFGAQSLKLTKFFKMRPQTRDGMPVSGGHINLPIVWQLPKD